ncbi:MAG: hypothetical protein PHT51_03370 [Patescibacteria group bacterium]|nr:hypothetical protein [Patescibacteria group bacterium]MDD4611204.1 hypothetical protein [Patescibacteria group bacterium]
MSNKQNGQAKFKEEISPEIIEKMKETPETKPETSVEISVEKAPEKVMESEGAQTAEKIGEDRGLAAVANAQAQKEQRKKEVENILAEDLEELYLSLPPDKQKEFKKIGEETAVKINNLLDRAKIKMRQVISLIRKWLAIIPGVNKFFLDQEAKIKADEIVKMKEENKL